MLRTLVAQADAIWPQESVFFERYALPEHAAVLDLGCGPGEISRRLLELFPGVRLLGLDLDESHLTRARERCAPHSDRVEFAIGDAVELDLDDGRFDLCVCRHLLQAVPHPEKVLANMVRVCKPGGRLHVVAEDYGMMFFHPTTEDIDAFWREGPAKFGKATGTDLLSGRKVFTMLSELGVRDVRVDYVVVDTVRVSRETFADIWIAWKDGYSSAIVEHTALDMRYVAACFDQMIACIRDPNGYAVWQLPVITGIVA